MAAKISKRKSKKASAKSTFWRRRFLTGRSGMALAFVAIFAVLGIATLLLTRAATVTGPIVNANGKCMGISPTANMSKNNPASIFTCNNSVSQTWTIPDNGTLLLKDRCLGINSSNRAIVQNCSGAASQKWTIQANGQIIHDADKLCLTNRQDIATDGNPVRLATCSKTLVSKQSWTVPSAAPTDGGGTGGDTGGGSDTGNGGSTGSTGSWPSTPPAQICGSDMLKGGPTSAPAGAITVPAGNNSTIDLEQAGKTYWFAPGTHTLGTDEYSQIGPDDNSTYIGAPGAILDGQYKNDYAFSGHATGVTIKYLTVQHFNSPADEGVVNHDSGDNWTMSYNTLTQNHGGAMFLGTNNVATYNCLKDNGQYGFQVYNNTSDPHNVTLDHNEIAGNNTDDLESKNGGCGCTGGGKFWSAHTVRVTNNYVHDNKSVGLWADTNDYNFLIEGNWIENNDSEAIFYEISYNAAIRNNVIKHNTLVTGQEFASRGDNFPEAAIYLSESGGDSRVDYSLVGTPTIDISNNLFQDNWSGITLWENADRYCNSPNNTSTGYCTIVNPNVTLNACNSTNIKSEPYYSDCRWKTQNVTITANEFRLNPANVNNCNSTYCGRMAILSNYGTSPSWSPYKNDVIQKAITFNQNNHWTNNKYFGSWKFMTENTDNVRDWSAWQASPYNQDAGSTKQ